MLPSFASAIANSSVASFKTVFLRNFFKFLLSLLSTAAVAAENQIFKSHKGNIKKKNLL